MYIFGGKGSRGFRSEPEDYPLSDTPFWDSVPWYEVHPRIDPNIRNGYLRRIFITPYVARNPNDPVFSYMNKHYDVRSCYGDLVPDENVSGPFKGIECTLFHYKEPHYEKEDVYNHLLAFYYKSVMELPNASETTYNPYMNQWWYRDVRDAIIYVHLYHKWISGLTDDSKFPKGSSIREEFDHPDINRKPYNSSYEDPHVYMNRVYAGEYCTRIDFQELFWTLREIADMHQRSTYGEIAGLKYKIKELYKQLETFQQESKIFVL